MTEDPQNPILPGIILLPTGRFFIRAIPLAAGIGAEAQVELAVENLAPFPLGQLYHGYWLTPSRNGALVFATYRKQYAAEETREWVGADAVLPAFLALLGDPPSRPTIRLWTTRGEITAVAWDGHSEQPIAVVSRGLESEKDSAPREALLDEIRQRTGLAGMNVQEYSGEVTVVKEKTGNALGLQLAGGGEGAIMVLDQAVLERADVRDKAFLGGRRAAMRRDLLLWRGFAAGTLTLVALLALEAVLLGTGLWLKSQQETVRQQAGPVEKIETAQTLSVRIEEMTQSSLKPFEMLAIINQNRPLSVQFIRSTTTGLHEMRIEAQTANADDVGQYEAVLRSNPALAAVETKLDLRDGTTTFVLTVTFKPGALQPGVTL